MPNLLAYGKDIVGENKDANAEDIVFDNANTSLTSNNVQDAIEEVNACMRTLKITQTNVTSLPKTVSNANIKSNMIVVESVLSNPAVQAGDWTVTTSDGSLQISGTKNAGSTDITLYLLESR